MLCRSVLQVDEQNANAVRWNKVCQNLHTSTFPGWASGVWEWRGRTEHSSCGGLNNSAPTLGRELRGGWPDRGSFSLSLERREQQCSAAPYESFHSLKGELQTKVGFLSFYLGEKPPCC